MMNIEQTSCPVQGERRFERATGKCWKTSVKKEWRSMVVEPMDFTTYREYELDAAKTIGTDFDGEKCYYAHHFSNYALRTDDDEDYYEALIYEEQVEAWRLCDDRWLIQRAIRTEEGATDHSFFTISNSCPR